MKPFCQLKTPLLQKGTGFYHDALCWLFLRLSGNDQFLYELFVVIGYDNKINAFRHAFYINGFGRISLNVGKAEDRFTQSIGDAKADGSRHSFET